MAEIIMPPKPNTFDLHPIAVMAKRIHDDLKNKANECRPLQGLEIDHKPSPFNAPAGAPIVPRFAPANQDA